MYSIFIIIIILSNFRLFDDEFYEMSCTFETFDMDILKFPLPYKYIVVSPKTKNSGNYYEYLHAHAASTWSGNEYDFNRCLVIPNLDLEGNYYNKK